LEARGGEFKMLIEHINAGEAARNEEEGAKAP